MRKGLFDYDKLDSLILETLMQLLIRIIKVDVLKLDIPGPHPNTLI